jgi:hypothetical protein
MGFLHNLKLWLSPPQMTDPDFGKLIFMHIEKTLRAVLLGMRMGFSSDSYRRRNYAPRWREWAEP